MALAPALRVHANGVTPLPLVETTMSHRITNDWPLPDVKPEERRNVGAAYVLDDGQTWFAMGFDPGDTGSSALVAHAVEMVTGLLYLRGWCGRQPEIRFVLANRPDRPWFETRGPRAFVVEVPVEPPNPARTDDLVTIVELITLVWCTERRLLRTGQPIPDLMSAPGPHGVTLATVHVELWSQAVSDVIATRPDREVERQRDSSRSLSSEFVDMHLGGTGLQTWSLPGRQSVFVSSACELDHARAFLALEDTHPVPRPERARDLLRLMLARRGREASLSGALTPDR